jgi:PAS domain-containing protein
MREDLRLIAVRRLAELDIENDKEFLEILRLASSVCETPYAFITLLDEDNQYIMVGNSVVKGVATREESFCQYTLEQDDVMIVEQALKDKRFMNHPQVKDDLRIRFYAGTPLTNSDGIKIGTLCVTDQKKGRLSGQQKTMLKILAKKVVDMMELRVGLSLLDEKQSQLVAQQKLIDDASIRLRSFFESSTNFHVLLGKHGEIIDFNKTAEKFIEAVHRTKIKRGELFLPYLAPDFVATFLRRYDDALSGRGCVEEGSTDYGKHGVIYWDATFEPAKDGKDNIIGISYLIRNVTDRKLWEQRIIKQNESLAHIAHIQTHEFRAPLTTIMGIMALIKEESSISSDQYFEILEQAVTNLDSKIKTIVSDIENNIEIPAAATG